MTLIHHPNKSELVVISAPGIKIRRQPVKRRTRIGLIVLLIVGLLLAGLGGAAYVVFSGWPHDNPPSIARGVITNADWLHWDRGSTKFSTVLVQRFPLGTSESDLRTALSKQGFKPAWRCPGGPYVHKLPNGDSESCTEPWNPDQSLVYSWGGLPCTETLSVWWSADRKGRIAHIEGHYGGACL